MKRIALLLALAGCDKLFDIDHLGPASTQDAVIGDSLDAENCDPTAHDEDNDGTPDDCDPCPAAAGTVDADGDGMPDVCDPRPMIAGDRILNKWMFNDDPSSSFTMTNATWDQTLDRVVLNSSAAFVSKQGYLPSAVDINVTSTTGIGVNAFTRLRTNVLCQVTSQDCTTSSTSTACLTLETNTTPYLVPASSLKQLRLVNTGSNQVVCTATSPTTIKTIFVFGSLVTTRIEVDTGSQGGTSLTSIVLYTY